QDVDQVKGSYARDRLDTILKELEVEGLFAKSISFETITLVSGQFQYDLPSDALDAVGIGMYIDPSQASSNPQNANELPVKDMRREEWQVLTRKDATGRPLKSFCHRVNVVPQVWYWPVPGSSEAGGIVRHQVHRLRADTTLGTVKPDYELYWNQFFIWELS